MMAHFADEQDLHGRGGEVARDWVGGEGEGGRIRKSGGQKVKIYMGGGLGDVRVVGLKVLRWRTQLRDKRDCVIGDWKNIRQPWIGFQRG
jgi:hypothetical protein